MIDTTIRIFPFQPLLLLIPNPKCTNLLTSILHYQQEHDDKMHTQDHIYDKRIIHLRLLKIISETNSLNISSVVSKVYTPTIPH